MNDSEYLSEVAKRDQLWAELRRLQTPLEMTAKHWTTTMNNALNVGMKYEELLQITLVCTALNTVLAELEYREKQAGRFLADVAEGEPL